jgi:hypothetical protein
MKKIVILILFGLILSNPQISGQIPNQAKKLQAIYIYNFMMRIQWPENKRNGDFVIGIVGNTPLAAELKNMAANT